MDEQLMDKDAEEEFLLRVAFNELKLSGTDDLIVEKESESVGENDVEVIEPEKAHEEKNKKKCFFSKIQTGPRAPDIIFRKMKKMALEPRALEPRTAVYYHISPYIITKSHYVLIVSTILRSNNNIIE